MPGWCWTIFPDAAATVQRSSNAICSSAYGVPAIYRECVTDHEACRGAAKPKNSISNLLGAAKPANGDVFQHRIEGVSLTSGDHLVRHRRMDETRTYGIDANAPRGIFQSRALGEPKHAVLGGVVCSASGSAHESSQGRAVDDRATSLLAHLTQLELHAAPYTTEIDGHHPVVIFPGSIGGF